MIPVLSAVFGGACGAGRASEVVRTEG
jgi:hypothetical protein